MEVVKTLLEQLAKNAKQAPGWVPLVVACYLLLALIDENVASLGVDTEKHKIVIVTLGALLFYVVGDALDQATFPRETEKGARGWKWLAPASLDQCKDKARKALSLNTDYYDVSKSLAVAAGEYTGSWIQFKNESAKFLRSAVFPLAALSLVLFLRNEWVWGTCAATASPLLLVLYGRLKGSHMCDLYNLAARLASTERERFTVSDLNNGVRLFFWKGKLISSGARPSSKPETAG